MAQARAKSYRMLNTLTPPLSSKRHTTIDAGTHSSRCNVCQQCLACARKRCTHLPLTALMLCGIHLCALERCFLACSRVRTPNYELYAAMTVDIHVNISGEGWTVNKIQFNYFANTSAKNCLAYGPGLLPQVSMSCLHACLTTAVAYDT